MIGSRLVLKRGGSDEAEKPFWISFSDLMSALMVLFLLVMSVALLAVTKSVSEAELEREQRRVEIEQLLTAVENATSDFPGVTVDRNRNSIDFGDRARFDFGKHTLSTDREELLRLFVPRVLEIARNELGRKWLKRIVVEGFTDRYGSYLFNLNLSLQRSQRVLCVLLDSANGTKFALTEEEMDQVRRLFLVGGYSSNSARDSREASRRIELRLEFLSVGEVRPSSEQGAEIQSGNCAIGA